MLTNNISFYSKDNTYYQRKIIMQQIETWLVRKSSKQEDQKISFLSKYEKKHGEKSFYMIGLKINVFS